MYRIFLIVIDSSWQNVQWKKSQTQGFGTESRQRVSRGAGREDQDQSLLCRTLKSI